MATIDIAPASCTSPRSEWEARYPRMWRVSPGTGTYTDFWLTPHGKSVTPHPGCSDA